MQCKPLIWFFLDCILVVQWWWNVYHWFQSRNLDHWITLSFSSDHFSCLLALELGDGDCLCRSSISNWVLMKLWCFKVCEDVGCLPMLQTNKKFRVYDLWLWRSTYLAPGLLLGFHGVLAKCVCQHCAGMK